MSLLLTELQLAITEVLTRHRCLDQQEAVYVAVTECLREPIRDEEFLTQVCELFNASLVPA